MKTTTSPRVSIGLPIYNGEKFLRETLDSLLVQSFEDFEVIISDNASTDKTEDICREYAAQDSRIRYYRNEQNIGAMPNHNRSFELSTGDYFKWIGSDDFIAPDYLRKCVEILDKFPSVTLCYTREIVIDENGKHLHKSDSYFVDFQSLYCHQRFKEYIDLWRRQGYINGNAITGLMRADKLRVTPLFDENMPSSELGLIGELLLLGDVYEVPEELMFFRVHPQTSRAMREKGLEAISLWSNPANVGKFQRLEWGLFFQLCSSIRRVPMKFHEKLFCYVQILKWTSWKWKRLVRELVMPNHPSF